MKAVLPVLVQRLLTLCVALVAALVLCAPASARTLKAIWGPTTLPNGQPAGPVYKDLGVDNVEFAPAVGGDRADEARAAAQPQRSGLPLARRGRPLVVKRAARTASRSR